MKSFFEPRPEMSHNARLQKLQQVKSLSPLAQRMDLARQDPETLRVLEHSILKEAREGAIREGKMFATRERDDGGRMITQYDGSPKAWMRPFMAKNLSIRFNSPGSIGTREETVRLRAGERVQIVSK